jgi:hypothetical protein
MAKHFTREEAERLLPAVEPKLRALQALRGELAEQEAHLAADRAKAMGNGHKAYPDLEQVMAEVTRIGERMQAVVDEINEMGILVKDLETGLIDFPAFRHGREVYLCWRLGEDGIGWWHDTDAGFAGRQPIETL